MYYIFCIIALSFSSISEVLSFDNQYHWERVPIYSDKYKPSLINEGMQMTHAIAYAPSNPSNIYLCTDTSRVWRSKDDGINWVQTSNGILSNGCRSLLVDPVNSDRVIVAGSIGLDEKKSRKRKWKHQGVYLTENGGESWMFRQKISVFRQTSKAPIIAYDSSSVLNDKTMVWYAGDYYKGLLQSVDGGLTWNVIESSVKGICAIKEDTQKKGELLIATESGLFRYNNKDLVKIGVGLPKMACAIAIHPLDSKNIIVAAGKKGVYKSVDGGTSFTPLNKNLFGKKVDIVSLEIGRSWPFRLYGKAHKSKHRLPFYSEDGGLTWKESRLGKRGETALMAANEHFWFSSAFAPHPINGNQSLVVSSGDGKVFKTNDGGISWNIHGKGYTGARVMGMSFSDNEIYLALTDFGLWKKNRDSKFFTQIKLPRYKGEGSSHHIGHSKEVVVSSVGNWTNQHGIIKRSDNRWRLIPKVRGKLENLFVLSDAPGVIYFDNYRTMDYGESWTKLDKSIKAVTNRPNPRLFTFEKGLKDNLTHVLTSDDYGKSWRQYAPPVPVSIRCVKRLVPDFHDGKKLYIATCSGVWVFDGIKWIKRSESSGLVKDAFGLNYISDLILDSKKEGRLIAGRAAPGRGVSNGIFLSEDAGKTWKNISVGLSENMYVWGLYFDDFESVVYASTDSGLIKLDLNN